MRHNAYFEGKVQSLALSEAGLPATVGVIEPGKYSFATSTEERMTITAGSVRVRLPGAEWKVFAAGETFMVPPNVSFDIEAEADAAYICRYR